jgi:hypothetical protein
LSLSTSFSTLSNGCQECLDIISFNFFLSFRICSACMIISVACHSTPPNGWCIIISLFGRANLFQGAPAVKRTAPIEAASPTQTVATSHLTYCIVS